MTPFPENVEKNKKEVYLRLLFTYLNQNLFNIKKHLALVLKKFVHIVFCRLQIYIKQSTFCVHYQNESEIYQCFSTIKTWMRILHDWLKKLKNWKVIKETLLFLQTKYIWLNSNVIKKWQPPPPHFYINRTAFCFLKRLYIR